REPFVAAGVIAVRMRVDDRGDRFVGDLPDPIEDEPSVTGELRVDDHDTRIGDEYAGIATREQGAIGGARRRDDVQVVFDFLEIGKRRLRRRLALVAGEYDRQHPDAQ